MPITPGNLKTAEIMLLDTATAHRTEHFDAPLPPLPPPRGGFIPSGEKVKDLTQKSETERKRKLFGVRAEEEEEVEEEEEEVNTLVRSAPSVSADVQLEGGLTEEFPTEFLFL
ncbi:hypothetical protein RUM43_002114 [Polyplax serrata]|uniref:Uncharacterized protein n=1 Tax=Polyplax serrata TaxID=468196 RepID=A0AAN8PLY0_POLSC